MQIRNRNIQLTENFLESELYSTDPNAPDSHYLDDRVVQALQYIRTLTGKPIRVTSTYRSPEYNALIGGSESSQHLYGRAIDFQWITNNEDELTRFHTELDSEGSQLKEDLYNIGVRGFGYYKTFVHIDTRLQSNWVTWGDDDAMIDQDGYTAYVYDVTLGFWQDYRNYIALAVLAVALFLLFKVTLT
jgi:uncharacterized protein YcbK (DUF882 family)